MVWRNCPHDRGLLVWVSSFRFCFSAAYLRTAAKECHNVVFLPLPPPSTTDCFLKNMISLWYFFLKSTASAFSHDHTEFREIPTTRTSFHCCKGGIIDCHLKLCMHFTLESWFCWLFLRSAALGSMLLCICSTFTAFVSPCFNFRCLLILLDMELALLFLISYYLWMVSRRKGRKDLTFFVVFIPVYLQKIILH